MRLPPPRVGDEVAWVREHLGHLTLEDAGSITASSTFRGGQHAGDAALAAFDVAGYAADRNEVWPPHRRGASRLSPYIRHGLLPLPRVWAHVAGGPPRDVRKFRDELLWQEYARHVYARLGPALAEPLRHRPPSTAGSRPGGPDDPWDRELACVGLVVDELEHDGWLVNQTRMWLASQWTVRHGWAWREGEDRFFRHLLDGSRAANRVGWQWTVGTATGKPYGFSRWQVERRAPGLCRACRLRDACPIEQWPAAEPGGRVETTPLLRRDPDPDATAGLARPAPTVRGPDLVWLTAESLGDDDPALVAHPERAVAFVFDERLLARLRLSGKRLVFLAETLAELAERRQLDVSLGDPVDVLSGRALATTFAPVPGWRRRVARLDVAQLHPWPWLMRPGSGPVTSFTAWRRAHGV
jgi:deoxyribodipyrimidine photo-lyase